MLWGSSPAAAALWQPLSTQLRRPSRAVGDSGRREDGQKLPFWVVGAERGCLMSVRVRGCAGAGCGRPGFSGISGFERRALQVLPMRMRMRMRQFPGHTRTHPGRPREGLYMHVTYYVTRHYPGLNSCPRPACGRPICPICPVCPAAIGSPLEAGQGQGRPGRAWIAPVGPRGSSEFLPLPIFWPLAFGLWPLQARQLRQRSAIVHRLAHSLSVGRSSRPSSSPPPRTAVQPRPRAQSRPSPVQFRHIHPGTARPIDPRIKWFSGRSQSVPGGADRRQPQSTQLCRHDERNPWLPRTAAAGLGLPRAALSMPT